MAKEIKELPDKKLEQLVNRVDEEDDLIHVDEEGFTVNHGSVGSKGIRYRFR
jgi:mRNA-degrading endonuclease RelE of RelBE toxin-antitoxin system